MSSSFPQPTIMRADIRTTWGRGCAAGTAPAPPLAAAGDRFRLRRHTTLWAFQWLVWCSREQYHIAPHPEHVFIPYMLHDGRPQATGCGGGTERDGEERGGEGEGEGEREAIVD